LHSIFATPSTQTSRSIFAIYAAEEHIPIRESGGKFIGYCLPTDIAGATSEPFCFDRFPSLAVYEVYRAKAAHPLQGRNAALLESSRTVISIQQSLIQPSEVTVVSRTDASF
jgi:hypothetical protein